jgi:hypothetical protein
MSTKWSSQILGKSGVDFGSLLKDEFSVILLQGKNTFGDMIYCYVKIIMPNMEKLQKALQSSASFNPSDFGEVIAAGKGTPADSVRAEIASLYPMLDKARMMQQAATPISAAAPSEKKNWDEY